jgi:hypothetical protein
MIAQPQVSLQPNQLNRRSLHITPCLILKAESLLVSSLRPAGIARCSISPGPKPFPTFFATQMVGCRRNMFWTASSIWSGFSSLKSFSRDRSLCSSLPKELRKLNTLSGGEKDVRNSPVGIGKKVKNGDAKQGKAHFHDLLIPRPNHPAKTATLVRPRNQKPTTIDLRELAILQYLPRTHSRSEESPRVATLRGSRCTEILA